MMDKNLHISPQLDQQLLQGRTLPAPWYTDPHVFNLERKHIFPHTWNYAARADLLQNHGDFITCTVGEVPIIVIVDEENKLKAFVNVCRHRGAQMILSENGNKKALQCHYHAWTWDLSGCLRSAPHTGSSAGPAGSAECFQKSEFPLKKVQVEKWGPFVFVNLDLTATSLASQLAGLWDDVTATGVDILNLQHHRQLSYEINCNWKITIENYLECYHCPSAHPELVKIVRMDDYQVFPFQYHSVQRCTLRPNSEQSTETEKLLKGAGSFLWPNFTINIYPGTTNVSSTIYIPVSVDKTIAIYDVYFPEAIAASDRTAVVDFLDIVQKQDTILCESVFRGMKSGHFQQGQLVLAKENGVQHFQRLLYQALVPHATIAPHTANS